LVKEREGEGEGKRKRRLRKGGQSFNIFLRERKKSEVTVREGEREKASLTLPTGGKKSAPSNEYGPRKKSRRRILPRKKKKTGTSVALRKKKDKEGKSRNPLNQNLQRRHVLKGIPFILNCRYEGKKGGREKRGAPPKKRSIEVTITVDKKSKGTETCL